jgi:hypothetical protein
MVLASRRGLGPAFAALAVSFLALSFLGEDEARAYCRTTTNGVTPGYDPTVSGCPTGTPLAWPSMPVTYQVFREASTQVTLADATAVIDRSFAKWPAVLCNAADPNSHPALSVHDDGPTDAPDPLCDDGGCPLGRDAVHAIYFRDDLWPYSDSANTLALTTVSYGVTSGHIFAAVMEINSHASKLSTANPVDAGEYSLEAIVTHEAGHFYGLAHSADPQAVMYARYDDSEPALSLAADDIAGICAAYPVAPPPPASSGCAMGGGPAPQGGALAAFALAGWGLAQRRRRRGAVAARPG